jgi:hypothetical protein
VSYYRRVDCRLWGDAKFRRLSEPARHLWLYLLTGPETTSLPGFLLGGSLHFAEALGWEPKPFHQRFGELLRERMAKADWEARFVWLPNALRYNPPANWNSIKSWATQWDLIPECELKVEAGQHLILFMEQLGKPFVEPFLEPLLERIAQQEEEEDQDQEEDQDKESRPTSLSVPAVAGVPALGMGPTPEEIQGVYEHYLDAMGKTPATYHLTPKRRTKIATRLRTWDVKALCAAIDACAASDFNMGKNNGDRLYNDLADHILRSDERVETWIYGKAKR